MPHPPDLAARINELRWFHQIDFGDGLMSPGWVKKPKIERMKRLFFDRPLAGKSVLDIGCWDGAYSIAATQLGAARVVASDWFVWNHGLGDKRAFELARAILAPSVELVEAPVEELTVERLGQFDIVLFAGVFYHILHPTPLLEQVAKLAREVLVFESRLCGIPGQLTSKPLMRFYPNGSLDNDPTNYWAPNPACMKALLRQIGFSKVKFQRADRRFRRGLCHAEW
ncbi:MAG: class I SAM-dependent methyltransferase [Hyphomonadaceae bacterium]